MLAARWISKRRHRHIRMRRSKKTDHRRKQCWLVAHLVILVAGSSLVLLVVSWKRGLLGIRVSEATLPGPATAAQTQSNEEKHNFLETVEEHARGKPTVTSLSAYCNTPSMRPENKRTVMRMNYTNVTSRMAVAESA